MTMNANDVNGDDVTFSSTYDPPEGASFWILATAGEIILG